VKHGSVAAREELFEVGLGDLVEIQPRLGRQLSHIPEHVTELGGQRAAALRGQPAPVVADRLLHFLGRLAGLTAQSERRISEIRAGFGVHRRGPRALLVVGKMHEIKLPAWAAVPLPM
jgi:hypothetical protein